MRLIDACRSAMQQSATHELQVTARNSFRDVGTTTAESEFLFKIAHVQTREIRHKDRKTETFVTISPFL